MTSALVPLLDSLAYPPGTVEYTFFTSPTTPALTTTTTGTGITPQAIPSINSPADAVESAQFCLPHLEALLPHHDAFLVACYSQHPLVGQLKTACAQLTRSATQGADGTGARKYVTGIFEASVLASLALLNQDPDLDSSMGGGMFGIVSTGQIWETALQDAVEGFLGLESSSSSSAPSPANSRSRFAGVETTGLMATELHDLPADEVRVRMIEATKRLLRRGASGSTTGTSTSTSRVKAICLGCAGMAGLDDAVRQACAEELGPEQARAVHVVDGVKAGVGILVGLARSAF